MNNFKEHFRDNSNKVILKSIILTLQMIALSIFIGVSIVGCSGFKNSMEITSTTSYGIEPIIEDTYYRSAYNSFIRSGNATIPVRHPEISNVTLSYDNATFKINCTKEEYDKYSSMIGSSIRCTLTEDHYGDGTIRRKITLQ